MPIKRAVNNEIANKYCQLLVLVTSSLHKRDVHEQKHCSKNAEVVWPYNRVIYECAGVCKQMHCAGGGKVRTGGGTPTAFLQALSLVPATVCLYVWLVHSTRRISDQDGNILMSNATTTKHTLSDLLKFCKPYSSSSSSKSIGCSRSKQQKTAVSHRIMTFGRTAISRLGSRNPGDIKQATSQRRTPCMRSLTNSS